MLNERLIAKLLLSYPSLSITSGKKDTSTRHYFEWKLNCAQRFLVCTIYSTCKREREIYTRIYMVKKTIKDDVRGNRKR